MEKYTLEAVLNTAINCNGINLCVVSPTYARTTEMSRIVLALLHGKLSVAKNFEVELKNGSMIRFLSSGSDFHNLRGRRYHQIFLEEEPSEREFEESLKPLLLSSGYRGGSIFRTGVFKLWDEYREVSNAAREISSIVYSCKTRADLQLASLKIDQIISKI